MDRKLPKTGLISSLKSGDTFICARKPTEKTTKATNNNAETAKKASKAKSEDEPKSHIKAPQNTSLTIKQVQTKTNEPSKQATISTYMSYSADSKKRFKRETKQDWFEPSFESFLDFDKQFKQKPMLQSILKDIMILHEEYETLESQSVDDEINKIRARHGLPLFQPEVIPVVETPESDEDVVLISDDSEDEEVDVVSTNRTNFVQVKRHKELITGIHKRDKLNSDVMSICEREDSSDSHKESQRQNVVNIQFHNKDFVLTSYQNDSSDEERLLVIDEDRDDVFSETSES